METIKRKQNYLGINFSESAINCHFAAIQFSELREVSLMELFTKNSILNFQLVFRCRISPGLKFLGGLILLKYIVRLKSTALYGCNVLIFLIAKQVLRVI